MEYIFLIRNALNKNPGVYFIRKNAMLFIIKILL
jgi:hypothetical protein